MKNIDYNYWTDGYGKSDADFHNPFLAIAMGELYGRKGFDFGKGRGIFFDSDKKNHYRADGYSSYTSLTTNYITRMEAFRPKAVENNRELANRCYFLAGTIAGEWFFPSCKLDGNTMNQVRATPPVYDMVYPALESIRKFYENESGYYDLKHAIERYAYFFNSFESFDEYVEYNFMQDYELLPKKFPTNENELVEFWKRSVEFMESRARRIEEYAKQNNLFDSE
jgi:hypothetical protein